MTLIEKLKSYVTRLTTLSKSVCDWFSSDDEEFEFEIPSGLNVTKIPDYAFYNNTNLTKATLSDDVESIGAYAFYQSGLKDISLGEGVVDIGQYGFYQCNNLTNITIPDSVTSIETYAFYGCSSLESVTTGSGVKSLGNYSFRECTSLATVNLSEGLEAIGDSVFYSCTSLTKLDMPDTVTSLGTGVFTLSSLAELTLSRNLTSLPKSLCSYCNLKSITIPENISTLGSNVFGNCTAAEELYFNATSVDDCTSSSACFSKLGYNSDGVRIMIGANVVRIPAYLFYVSTSGSFVNALSVTFADESNCTEIGNYAFKGLKNIESMEIPASVTSIGTSAFPTCLTQLILNCAEGDIDGAPWGATGAEIIYNGTSTDDTEDAEG